MNIKSTIKSACGLASLAVLLFYKPACADTTEWLVTPQYDRIEFFASDIYKVNINGKSGLIDSKGNVLLAPLYDEISDFHDGMAVFVDYAGNRVLVRGNIDSDYNVNYVNGQYFLRQEYPFYSEGFITVTDASGRYGYLDEKCRPVFEFSYSETRPFSEGLAAVGTEDYFHWITGDGDVICPMLPNGEYPYQGTNFYNGIAYAWDEEGVMFEIDIENDTMREIRGNHNLIPDYMFRLNSDKGEYVEFTKEQPVYETFYKPIQKKGKWSYTDMRGKRISNFQYDDAQNFIGDVACANVGGKWGLIHVVESYMAENDVKVKQREKEEDEVVIEENETFFVRSDRKVLVYSGSKGSVCTFRLYVPEKWKNESLSVSVTDPANGATFATKNLGNGKYSFSYQPDAKRSTVSKTFAINVINDGDILWQGEENYNFAQAQKLSAKLTVNRKANKDNRCTVVATIKNPSSIPVTTTVTLSGGGTRAQFSNKTVKVTIPANGTRSVSSAFVLKNVELNGWCAVSTSNGGHDRVNNLQLKPRD